MDFVIVFLSNFLIPIIMILLGSVMAHDDSSEINMAMGYRSKRSMASKEAWRFAQQFSGKTWMYTGITLLILTIITLLLLMKNDSLYNATVIIIIVHLVIMIATIIPTEIMLKKKFGD